MPDRIALHDGLLDSDSYNALDADARDLYVRLLLLADDFGCYDGREQIIASQAYPHGRADALPLDQLHAQGMVVFYMNAGRRYLAITRWREALRIHRKFPAPPLNVDLPELVLRVKFGRPGGIQWKNPRGADEVSILLDRNWKPVTPQPPEWRNTSDWSPLTAVYAVTARQRAERTQGLHAPPASTLVAATARSDGKQFPAATGTGTTTGTGTGDGGVAADAGAGSDCTQSLASTAAGDSNGLVKFENGDFIGLTEAQRLRWQEMFTWPIPDQIERSAAWLQANHGERAAIEKLGEGFESFIFRWLLREDRSHGT